MFDPKKENREALERAWVVLEDKDREDSIEHSRMEELLGVERPDSKYYALVEKLRRKLLAERGILLANIPMVGYELADADRQLLEAEVREQRAGSQRRKGLKAVVLLPNEDCTFEQQRKKVGLEKSLSLAVRQSQEEARRISFLMRPKKSDRPPDDATPKAE